jgi:putative endonuclease
MADYARRSCSDSFADGGSTPPASTSLRSHRSGERRLSRRSLANLNWQAKADHRSSAARLRLGMPAIEYTYVYILVSEADPACRYTGCTTDLPTRLAKHNESGVTHTAKHRPWRVETVVRFSSQAKARAFEQYLKSGPGREFSRRHF